MDVVTIEGATRVLGEKQGYNPLPVKDEIYTDEEAGLIQMHTMTAAFKPTAEELIALMAGGTVTVCIQGTVLPLGSTVAQHIKAGSGWPPILVLVQPIDD